MSDDEKCRFDIRGHRQIESQRLDIDISLTEISSSMYFIRERCTQDAVTCWRPGKYSHKAKEEKRGRPRYEVNR